MTTNIQKWQVEGLEGTLDNSYNKDEVNERTRIISYASLEDIGLSDSDIDPSTEQESIYNQWSLIVSNMQVTSEMVIFDNSSSSNLRKITPITNQSNLTIKKTNTNAWHVECVGVGDNGNRREMWIYSGSSDYSETESFWVRMPASRQPVIGYSSLESIGITDAQLELPEPYTMSEVFDRLNSIASLMEFGSEAIIDATSDNPNLKKLMYTETQNGVVKIVRTDSSRWYLEFTVCGSGIENGDKYVIGGSGGYISDNFRWRKMTGDPL